MEWLLWPDYGGQRSHLCPVVSRIHRTAIIPIKSGKSDDIAFIIFCASAAKRVSFNANVSPQPGKEGGGNLDLLSYRNLCGEFSSMNMQSFHPGSCGSCSEFGEHLNYFQAFWSLPPLLI